MLRHIKILIKKAIQGIILLIFNRITRYLIAKIKFLGNLFYSYYIGAELKSISEGYLFEFPSVLKGGKYIEIGKQFSARARLRIEAWDHYHGADYNPKILIGDNVNVNFDCHFGAINRIEIGNNVLIGSRVLIIDHNHGLTDKESLNLPPVYRSLFSKGPIIIENNVWIGEGVAILPNVRIGENSIIGANSVVTKDVPPNCIVSGVPAVIIKQN